MKKFFNKDSGASQRSCADEIRQILNDIKEKEIDISEKKSNIKQEHIDGSRITKHKFTL
ncbi:TPA: hypothetical protein SMG08_001667 [Serratia marcescens]|uniref:hypothetical protein n=1 Tax=Serratia TaxID=613 RepID=UPI0021BDB9BA|nr:MULTISPECIES: hypothetical protein [Serratia]MDI6977543.1 hypothetical protein [Serratia sp. Se-RSBMAAmG]MDI9262421.1 hypothetical protein [Serratia sp. PF2-63]MDI9271274.1 hypothetical protein [Serratia sp. PF-27]HEJ7270073.1 hypothetical protein [Serratia marcescens]